MNLNTIKQTRHQIWQCFSRSGDALFVLADALTCESAARSLPELSLSPAFRRKWPSIYEAQEDGRVESHRWSEVWTAALLTEHEGPVWISIDATSIARPEFDPGKGGKRWSLPGKYADVCPLFWLSWAHLLKRPKHAENRLGGPKGLAFGKLSAIG